MKINIIIMYRPLCGGGFGSPSGKIIQLPDGRWEDENGSCAYTRQPGVVNRDKEDELIQTIKLLNKNSYYKHNIIAVIDNDVYPNDTYLKEFDNVRIVKARHVDRDIIKKIGAYRFNVAEIDGVNSVPDDELICFPFPSDGIPNKDWDKYIIDEIQKYGINDFVYVPMFVEIKLLSATEPTPERIWNEWRKTICGHALTMPIPAKGYVTQEDIDYYIKKANEAGKIIIIERSGDRIYGFFSMFFMKAHVAKKAIKLMGLGFDIAFDDALRDEFHLMKIVVTRSFIFHPYSPTKIDV